MRRFSLRLLMAVLAVVIASPLVAQQRQRPGQGFGQMGLSFLVSNKSVQDEVKITEEQAGKFKEIAGKYRDELKSAREDKDNEKVQKLTKERTEAIAKAVKDTLKPEQIKRLHQIEVQAAGLAAFSIERVQKELKLTDKQQEKIKEMSEEMVKSGREAFKEAQGDQEKMQELFKKMNAKRKEALEKVVSDLSDEQKKCYKELTGAPFEIKIQCRRPE